MNTVMTAGMHHRWRERAADRAELVPGDAALDLCCGTGDLALALASGSGPGAPWWAATSRSGCSTWRGARPRNAGRHRRRFEWADALELPYRTSRSTPSRWASARETWPISSAASPRWPGCCKPGGRAVILEITQPRRPPLSTFYSLWFDRLVPLLGAPAGDRDAYSYLPESVKSFPQPAAPGGEDGPRAPGADSLPLLAGGIIAIHPGERSA